LGGGGLFFFLNEVNEGAQGRKQIHNGGLRHSEAFSSSVFGIWTEATTLCAMPHSSSAQGCRAEFSFNISEMGLANMRLLNEVGLHYLILHNPFTDFIQQSF